MARGYDRHQARLSAVAALGRQLARRARSRCELCEASGVPLAPCEVPPLEEEPDPDRTILICEECAAGVAGGRGPIDAGRWRFLESVVWSDLPPVQVAAVRMLRKLVAMDVAWAREVNDSLYLSEDVKSWIGTA